MTILREWKVLKFAQKVKSHIAIGKDARVDGTLQTAYFQPVAGAAPIATREEGLSTWRLRHRFNKTHRRARRLFIVSYGLRRLTHGCCGNLRTIVSMIARCSSTLATCTLHGEKSALALESFCE